MLDAAGEADALAAVARAAGRTQDVLVRVTPDIAVDTHDKIRTGHAGSKFGLDPHAAAALATSLPARLRFAGLHLHLGSQVIDAAPLRDAASWCAAFIADAGIDVETLDLGGGLGVSYAPSVASPDPGRYVTGVRDAVQAAWCGESP